MIIGYHKTITEHHSTFGTSSFWNIYGIPFNDKGEKEYEFCHLNKEVAEWKYS
jgi:hypothetical protein